MNRDEIRERFSPLLDGELGPEERAEVEAALSEDAELLRELDALKRVDQLYANLPPLTAPDGFEDGVRSALRPATTPFVRAVHRRLWPMLAAAAVFLVFGAIIVVQMNPEMAPMLLSREMATERAETAPRQALSQPDLAAESVSADQTFAPQSLDETRVFEVPEADMDTLRGPGAASSGNSNGAYLQKGSVNKEEASAGEAEKRLDRPSEPLPETTEVLGRARAGALADDESSPQRQAGIAPEMEQIERMESLVPSEAPVAEGIEPSPSPGLFGDEATKPEPPAASQPEMPSSSAREAGSPPPPDRAEYDAAGPTPQIAMESTEGAERKLADRTFGRIGEDWIQDGYDNETLTAVQRESDAWNVLVRKDFTLTAVLELEGRVVFKQGDIWYELLPAIASD
jgi:hypothetical protein